MYLKTKALNPYLITGYTTRLHLLLDLDNRSLTQVRKLCQLLQEQYPLLGDALICLSTAREIELLLSYLPKRGQYYKRKSSSYHIIFDNIVGYNFCSMIYNNLCSLDVVHYMANKIRGFRGDMTLRVSPKMTIKGTKPIPTPIEFIPNNRTPHHHGMIGQYLKYLEYARKYFQTPQSEYDITPI